MVVLHDLPVELLEKILRLLGDPVSVRRASLVCQQWADIIHNLLLRGSITCNPKVWWLDTQFPSFFCERFYGDWQQQKVSTRRSPSLRGIGLRLSRRGLWLLPELRRFLSFSFFFHFQFKVFLTHMEIIRVKYPNSLHKLHKDATSRLRWIILIISMI